jgi:hypothetical protein
MKDQTIQASLIHRPRPLESQPGATLKNSAAKNHKQVTNLLLPGQPLAKNNPAWPTRPRERDLASKPIRPTTSPGP